MSDSKNTLPVMIYTEQTPNPESLKYVTNRMLYRGMADFQDRAIGEEWSPFAKALFEMDEVKGVYIANNFITITKDPKFDWLDIMLKLKSFIKEYLESKAPIINEGYTEYIQSKRQEEDAAEGYSEKDQGTVRQIKEILNTYVKPAVEMDGGNIIFKGFEEGIVTLEMQGACSGCPSSTMTLKAGIESMMKRMVPEVKEVKAVDQI